MKINFKRLAYKKYRCWRKKKTYKIWSGVRVDNVSISIINIASMK